ncbi:MAG: hypothetical protein M1840_001639 [Geoglossum simile]|nr:MAG: hypothetical protein M1840_001639 [Geoglossum simile]
MSQKGGMVMSIKDDSGPHIEAEIATKIVAVAHWIQPHENAIKLPHGLYVAANNSVTVDEPSTTIEFYLHRIPRHEPKLHVMGDLYLICRAKIGSLIQELDDRIRADTQHDVGGAVQYFGRDGKSRGRRVTIGYLLDILKEKAEILIDFAPFVIEAMNKHYERERALRVLEGLEDMTLPQQGFVPHQNAEPRIVSNCSKLSPSHIFAHLNEKHREESLQEEQRRDSQFARQAIETAVADSDPEGPRRAAFANFESVRDKSGSGGLSGCRDMSYFSDKNVSSRYDPALQTPAYKPYDSGYVSGATIEQLGDYNKLASEKESMAADRRDVEPSNTASQAPLPQLRSQMTTSPTLEFQQLTNEVWAGYGCNRHVSDGGNQRRGDESFDWDALIEHYPASASYLDGSSDDAFSWEIASGQTRRTQLFPTSTQCDNSREHAEIDNSYFSYGVSQLCYEEQAHIEDHGDNQEESDSVPDEETVLRKRAHAMALLEGTDEDASEIANKWGEGKARRLSAWNKVPGGPEEDLKNTEKGIFHGIP